VFFFLIQNDIGIFATCDIRLQKSFISFVVFI